MALEKVDEEQNVERKALCEDNTMKLVEAKTKEIEQTDDVSEASQKVSNEVSQTDFDDGKKSNRIE